MKKQAKYLSSESVEWYTPPYITDLVIKVLGEITLDPCSNPNKSVPALHHFTKEDDGLNKEWFGNVFMNPPYGAKNSKEWSEKFIRERVRTKDSIVLIGSNTDTNYFNHYLKNCNGCCLVQRRIAFISGDVNETASSNTRSSAFFYFGKNPFAFTLTFCNIGNIITLFSEYSGNHNSLK